MKLYNTVISGNCYKIRLLLSFLNLDYEKVSINLADQEQKTEHFLKLNPLGQIPVLEDQGRHIHDSQAILCYLARTYDAHQLWFPQETIAMTHVLEWLFFANQRIASTLSMFITSSSLFCYMTRNIIWKKNFHWFINIKDFYHCLDFIRTEYPALHTIIECFWRKA